MPALLRLPRQYLFRDLIGTLAPFSAFLLLAVLADASAVTTLLSRVRELLKDAPWAAAVLWGVTGYAAGKIVGAAGVWLTRVATRMPRIGQRYSYAAWYERQRAPIEQLYKHTCRDVPAFELSLTDKVNALKSYFAAVHPEGFTDVMRQFLIVDVTRASFVYSAVLFVNEALAFFPRPGFALLCATIVLVTALATPRRIEKVVRTEMVFLVAAVRMKADIARAPNSP